MKRTKLAIMTLLPALFALPALAGESGPQNKVAREKFAEADINGDGVISGAEHEETKRSKFAESDADGNGNLSYEEALALFKDRQKSAGRMGKGPGAGRMFGVLDIDGDGLVSFEEFSVMGDRRFKGMDANLDGEVTFLEALAEGRERMMRHKKGR